ncbi:MAG: UDP-N-acetylmuramate dehydrogenase [Hungatella sp.]|nr:UDP-N-acetylmuramate dehydrogenase [Hungatella sp.]
MKDLKQELVSLLGTGAVRPEEPMKGHTTFRIGGPVQFFITPKNTEELVKAITLCRSFRMACTVIGNGSNLLVSDRGWRGTVISTENLKNFNVSQTSIWAEAGVPLARLASQAKEASLTGLEFAAGIPGTLGGALVMNAGAYGSEMKDILLWADVWSPDGIIHRKTARQLELGYRTSCIPKEEYVVLAAELALREGVQEQIKIRMEELGSQRKDKQPLEYPSAGSTFKRPPGHFAGKLIDEAGLRGYQVGGAAISEKHCGFVINKDHATAEDVITLCKEVTARVKRKTGVELELEVKVLGDEVICPAL